VPALMPAAKLMRRIASAHCASDYPPWHSCLTGEGPARPVLHLPPLASLFGLPDANR
jgi:hypothetical protein